MSVAIIAFGAISGQGRGLAAVSVGEVGETAKVATRHDAELAAAKLARPFCARAPIEVPAGTDRATAILRAAWEDLRASLDKARPGWRALRVGLALATSSGGMRSAEELFRALRAGTPVAPEVAERATYFAPMMHVFRERFAPSTLVLTACSASTVAIGLGAGWLARGECDLVIAGGFDGVSVFVASGFEALRATTAQLPSRPFGLDRDGMALGEGAGLLALVHSEDEGSEVLGYIDGFGASGDAIHVTAPDRTGAGLARAAAAALEAMDPKDVAIVSAHGTATPFNDAAETKAIRAALGAAAEHVVVHPFKAQIGHTLGAAGALESLAVLDAMHRGVLPAAVVPPVRDPETPLRLLERTEKGTPEVALKLSAAFGGANAALVLHRTRPTSRERERHEAHISAVAHVDAVPSLTDLSAAIGIATDRLSRADELVHLALAAIARLPDTQALRGAGIVVGHAYATVDVNDRYFQRVLERDDAKAAEPRRFPYTSPNAVAGECSLAFGLTGPNVAVGSGLHGGVEALIIAADLVRSGAADRVIAVAVDAPRRAARAIAEALGWPLPKDGAVAVLVSRARLGRRIAATEIATAGASAMLPHAPGHEALLPLTTATSPGVACASPWGAFARVDLDP